METSRSGLKTEAEYDVALLRVIELFNAEEGTPEGDELDILLPLVIDYEAIHYPIPDSIKKIKANSNA